MKINSKLKRGFTLVELLVVIAIIASLAALSTPAITSALQRAALTTSINNARQISLALNNYAIDFNGNYVNDQNGPIAFPGANTNTSEGCFTVLLNSGMLTTADEGLFYYNELANAGIAAVEGNNDGTLAANENGYSYVKGLFNTSNGPAPLVTTKLQTAGGTGLTGTFYSAIWNHKAVIARVNNSVSAERISGAAGTDGSVLEAGAAGGGSSAPSDVFGFAVGGDVLQ